MSNLNEKSWRELSEAASQESDPQMLMELVEALNNALDRHQQSQRAKRNTFGGRT